MQNYSTLKTLNKMDGSERVEKFKLPNRKVRSEMPQFAKQKLFKILFLQRLSLFGLINAKKETF